MLEGDADPADFARRIRVHALRMVHAASASHIGGCLSAADAVAVLYARVLRLDPAQPAHPDRDRFLMSKGHAAAILYAALAERGFFPVARLEEYCRPGSALIGHVSHAVPGVEVSSGSLGHSLPIAAGMALAARVDGRPSRVFCLMSDGECNEGSNWEAALFAGHHRLGNLVAVIDYNRLQSFARVDEVMRLDPLADKWRAFGWRAIVCNGHDHAALSAAFAAAGGAQPTVVIGNTIKGCGVSFMQDRLEWHYKSPNPEQLQAAITEVMS